MRISALELSSFRGFAKTQRFDLDADAVIIMGPNGQGKTSVFDAILWAMTGRISRLGEDTKPVVSVYSDSGNARVTLDLRTDDDESLRIIRSFDGERERLRLEYSGAEFQQTSARSKLLELLWPQALLTEDGFAALESAIACSVYLQQDLVRKFIEADEDQDRFNAISELVGVGRVTELQIELENAKKAWTLTTNNRNREGQAARDRLSRLEDQLLKLSQVSGDVGQKIEAVWSRWWQRFQELGASARGIPTPDSVEAPSALDNAVKQLDALRRSCERQRELSAQLLSEIRERSKVELPNVATLQDELESIRRDAAQASEALAQAESHAAAERRAQVELREAREEVRSLAKLALRHLGERCPVCAQEYDIEGTRRRLEELLAAPNEDNHTKSIANEVQSLAMKLEGLERAESEAKVKLRQAEQSMRDYNAWIADRDRRLEELGIDPNTGSSIEDFLKDLVNKLAALSSSLASHQEEGEQLALSLAQAADIARKAELERELVKVRKEVESLDALIRSRERTGELAGLILDGLREAASDVVEARLERIEPLLQRIYARIDPHPTFRVVRFLTRFKYGRGRLATIIDDPLAELTTDSPSTVLSSSQLNALAVAIFLAFNLGVPALPLSSALLDDPLQSLDDVNLLGLIDLFRRTKDRRQLFISTHDVRFGRLLERKLRPIVEGQRTRVIELDGWSREGPDVTERDVPRDSKPLRIAP